MTTPYTYLIGWPELNTWYYGVRYAIGCNPTDLWDPYKTSSKEVAKFILEHGDPPVRKIRKTFKDIEDAITASRIWEHKVLRRLKVIKNDKWLNKTDNKAFPPTTGQKRPNAGRKIGTVWSDDERRSKEQQRNSQEYKDKMRDLVYDNIDRNNAIGKAHSGKIGVATGKKWYNNGKEEKYLSIPIEGWSQGRLYCTNAGRKGLRWYNNGIIDKQYKEGQAPEGFKSGRISKKH
jgi:hypothetical protein